MTMNDDYTALEDVVRSTFYGVAWSHKIQEKQSDIYAKKYKRMETMNILAASLTSVGIVAIIFTDPLWLKLISAFLSFATVYITAYYKSFDLQKLTGAHKSTANRLLTMRNQYIILLAKIKMQSQTVEELLQQYEDLMKQTDAIYLEAPTTSDEAVELASNALKIKKDNTFTDEEIDLLLPESLRRCNCG